MDRSAEFSEDRVYRYRLERLWGEGPTLNVIGLNPSTADETIDDPTIRRCIGFAQDMGYGRLLMTNLFGFRATDPRVMAAAEDPVGNENDVALLVAALESAITICAWGAHPLALERGKAVASTALSGVELHCLGTTAKGAPRHPLYLPKTTRPVLYLPSMRSTP